MRNYWPFFETFPETHGKNSSKFSENSKKTKKPATPVELSWRRIVQIKAWDNVEGQMFLKIFTKLTPFLIFLDVPICHNKKTSHITPVCYGNITSHITSYGKQITQFL